MYVKRMILFTSGLIIPCMALALLGGEYPDAKVTLKVVDEEGKSVEEAGAGIGFFGRKGEDRKGKTDKDGIFSAQSPAHDGEFAFIVKKDGYYNTNGRDKVKMPDGKLEQKDGKWQPWNPTIEVVLKKMINPVPMYAKRVEVEIPELNKEIGYDLVAGDWVAPHGKGITTDIMIQATRDDRGGWKDFDCSLKLRFPNKGDGIQGYFIENYRFEINKEYFKKLLNL